MNTTAVRGIWPLAATQVANAHLTWEQWCARQERQITRRRHHGELPFSDRELAHLAFLRWLHAGQADHDDAGFEAA